MERCRRVACVGERRILGRVVSLTVEGAATVAVAAVQDDNVEDDEEEVVERFRCSNLWDASR